MVSEHALEIFDPKTWTSTTKFDAKTYMFAYWTELFDIVEPNTTVHPVDPVDLTTTMPERKEKGES